MSELARGGRKRRIATGGEEEEEVKVERTRESSEREMEEVEELASNSRLLDSLIVISNAEETSMREVTEGLSATIATMRLVGVVVNAVRIIGRTRAVTVVGRVVELIEEKATGKQVGGRGTLFSNHLTLKQRNNGEIFLFISKYQIPCFE